MSRSWRSCALTGLGGSIRVCGSSPARGQFPSYWNTRREGFAGRKNARSAGGPATAYDRAEKIGAEAAQIFLTPPQQWRSSRVDEPQATLKFSDYVLEKLLGAGGKGNFSDYYNTKYDGVRFQPGLAKNIVFAQHNLVTDGSFNEFNVILCRNVMIYFNRELQNRVHGLLYESLMHLGFLGLGEKENLLFSPHESAYGSVDDKERLFRKVR